jgi:hypothetical protein
MLKALKKLLEMFIPEIRNAFLASIQDIVDNIVLNEIIEAIKDGDIEKAFRRTGMTETALRPIMMTIERAFETGGITVAQSFPKNLRNSDGRVVFRFDIRDNRAERWVREQSSQLITKIQEDTRTATRNLLEVGIRDGRNPRNVALDLVGRIDQSTGKRTGGVIGLTPGQEAWARRTAQDLRDLNKAYFNRELRDKRFDRTVMKAINDGKPLSEETISKLVNRYRDNALKYRGEVIGRTEAIEALQRSEFEATQQMIDTGSVSASAVTKTWDATGDKRTRPSHMALDGTTIPFGQPFVFSDGTQAMHPGDSSLGASAAEIIQCRCRMRINVDWMAGVR